MYGKDNSNKYAIELSFLPTYYKYNEPDVMNIKGSIYLLQLNLSYININYPNIKFEAGFNASLYAHNKYFGKTIGGAPVVGPKSNDSILNPQFMVGYFNNNIHTYFYSGFGYYFLHNLIDHSGAYVREQHYLYLPFGFKTDYPISDIVSLRLNLEYSYIALGINHSYIEHINGDRITFIQRNDLGLRAVVGPSFNINDNVKIFLEFFYRYFYVDTSSVARVKLRDSNTWSEFIEPLNYTNFIGSSIGLSYEF